MGHLIPRSSRYFSPNPVHIRYRTVRSFCADSPLTLRATESGPFRGPARPENELRIDHPIPKPENRPICDWYRML